MTTITKSIELHSSHGGSDKVYNIQLCEVTGGFVVNYQNGRRGGTLVSGTKTKSPVASAKAPSIYEKLIAEKINGASHYKVVGSNSTSAASIVTEKEASGFLPMLPTAVDAARVAVLLGDDNFCLQEKIDGERVFVIVKANGTVIGANRLGFVRRLPLSVVAAVEQSRVPPDTVLDGELVNDVFHVFDLLRANGNDCTTLKYEPRRDWTLRALDHCHSERIRCVESFFTRRKSEALRAFRTANAEGIILRDRNAPYSIGRTFACLKYKFIESATLLVDGHEMDKRSVFLGAMDADGIRVTMGKVTIPPSFDIPAIDSVVEVAYLYAYPGTHALAQRVYRGIRADQTVEACILAQLKYKTTTNNEAIV